MKIPQEVKSKKFWKVYVKVLVVVVILGFMIGFVIEKGIYAAATKVTDAYTAGFPQGLK